ncbi:hypothetical protein LCGC14_1236410 [marine sediment metagenome]|uniref:Uncharacterized protein n=1 Tax=marine sediment metagenome TaxID=412755 RepID=A0A0F9LU81_9ZZZZ
MFLQALKVMTCMPDNSAMTESDETTFWQRLGEAMLENDLKHTQTAAGALINSKGNTAAKKWQDGGYPSMTNSIAIALKLSICVEWLLTGRGSKYPINGPLNETEFRVLMTLRTSDESQRHVRLLHDEVEANHAAPHTNDARNTGNT